MRKQCIRVLLGLIVCLGFTVNVDGDVTDIMETFRQNHPDAQFLGAQFYEHESFFDEAGTTSTIWGTVLATGNTQIDSAWNHVNEVRGMLGDDIGELVPKVQADGNVLIGAMYDRASDSYGFSTFRFDQFHNGIPVFRSGVGFLVRNDNENSLMMSSFNVRDMAGQSFGAVDQSNVQITPEMLDAVQRLMEENAGPRSLLGPVAGVELVTEEERFVIYAGANERIEEPQLAVEFIATRGTVQTYPDYQRFRVIASVATGEILMSENQVQTVDVEGNVSGRATEGLNSLNCGPEAVAALPYALVQITGGNSTFADVNGDFTIANGGTADVTVTSQLRGQWFEVRDQSAGNSFPTISQTATPGTPVNFVHNPTTNNDTSTANVNAYLESNIVRDYTLFYAPNYPVIANQTAFDINTNIGDNCNAFYNGVSTNYFTAGGGCNNTSFSDVVHHEYGHHLIQVSGNGQGQLGEGSGDVMGVLIQDDPVLGQGFTTCGQGIRDARNFRTFPCTDGASPHDCGQLISGCVWDLRNELAVTEPNDFRDINASLFVNMLIARGQQLPGNGTIDPTITAIYLTLDGGAHCTEIMSAFGAHNMDVANFALVEYSFPSGRPTSIDPVGGVTEFTVQIEDGCEELDPSTVTLNLNRGSGNETFNLSGTGNVFDVVFPAVDCNTEVSYFFSAQTTTGVNVFSPADANTNVNSRFTAFSATEFINSFDDNSEVDMGWAVTGNATDGQWNRGLPLGGGDRADPAVDADGSGAAWLTDRFDGNTDVDGGTTTLTSPILDASGNGTALVSYYRWYSVGGNATGGDLYVVDISDDGGATWVNMETVPPTSPDAQGGWIRRTFDVSNFVTPTNNVRVRFSVSDTGGGSLVEGGVDGISVDVIECGPPPVLTIPPEGTTVFRGTQIGGTTADLEDSDDVFTSYNPGFTLNSSEAPVWVITEVNLPVLPDTMSIVVESQANTPGLTKTTEAFNFTTGGFDVIDTASESFNVDSVVNVDVTADIPSYVQGGSNAALTRVGWRQTGFTLIFPWEARIDRMVWVLNQQ